MVPKLMAFVERGRVLEGDNAWVRANALHAGTPNGVFLLRAPGRSFLKVLASNGDGWEDAAGFDPPVFEHVSVSVDRENRCPTWDEMSWVKGLWWGPEELVVQYHPPKSVYVNHHPYTLHLWRPVGVVIPLPPRETIA